MITKIINLFGGPGCGKSTTALGLAFYLKVHGFTVEYVSEYAKDLVWEGTLRETPQVKLWKEQSRRVNRLIGKVEWVVTDSPTVLSLIYGKATPRFALDVWTDFVKNNNINIVVRRVKPYSRVGRGQTERQAKALDAKIIKLVQSHWYANVWEVDGNEDAPRAIFDNLKDMEKALEFNS